MRSYAWRATPRDGFARNAIGVVMLRVLDESAETAAPRWQDERLLDLLLTRSSIAPGELHEPRVERIPPELLARLVCPFEHAPLTLEGDELVSPGGRRYVTHGPVPILRDDEAPDPTVEDLKLRLAARWPDQDTRVAAAVALWNKLVIPHEPDRVSWDFTDPDGRRGWLPEETMVPLDGSGAFWFRTDTACAWFISPFLAFQAERLEHVEVQLRVHNPDHGVDGATGGLFWLGEEDDGLEDARSVRFPVKNDNTFHTYRVDPRSQPTWPRSGRILCLRIDPANGPCEFEFRSFALRLHGPHDA